MFVMEEALGARLQLPLGIGWRVGGLKCKRGE